MQQNQENYNDHHQQRFDSIVGCEVAKGLVAAKQYERSRPRLSRSVQDATMKANFRQAPDGDVSKRLSEDEYMQLRASMQNYALQTMFDSMANLREQMTEYHSVIGQLSSITVKYENMQKTLQASNERVYELEHEVIVLKKERHQHAPGLGGTAYNPRHGSCQGGYFGAHHTSKFSPRAPMQMQQLSNNLTLNQSRAAISATHQDLIPFCSAKELKNEHQVAKNPFCYGNQLQARRDRTPPPSISINCLCSSTKVRDPGHTVHNISSSSNGFKHAVGGFPPITTKRTRNISKGY